LPGKFELKNTSNTTRIVFEEEAGESRRPLVCGSGLGLDRFEGESETPRTYFVRYRARSYAKGPMDLADSRGSRRRLVRVLRYDLGLGQGWS
jgi:hypothetical protein